MSTRNAILFANFSKRDEIKTSKLRVLILILKKKEKNFKTVKQKLCSDICVVKVKRREANGTSKKEEEENEINNLVSGASHTAQ